MRFVHLFFDKFATMPKSIALVAFLVHALVLIRCEVHRRWFVENGLTLVGLFQAKRDKYRKKELNRESREKWVH